MDSHKGWESIVAAAVPALAILVFILSDRQLRYNFFFFSCYSTVAIVKARARTIPQQDNIYYVAM